jgi:hypothetical protein
VRLRHPCGGRTGLTEGASPPAAARRTGASPRGKTGGSPLAATAMHSVLYRVYGAEREARTRLHSEKGRSYDSGNLDRLHTRAQRRE